jgi:hypothetical protein
MKSLKASKITDWSKWEDPFRLTMDAYWKYQAEKEKNCMPFLMLLLKTDECFNERY